MSSDERSEWKSRWRLHHQTGFSTLIGGLISLGSSMMACFGQLPQQTFSAVRLQKGGADVR